MSNSEDATGGDAVAEAEAGKAELSRIVEVRDRRGQVSKHSATIRKCCLQVYGQPFSQITMDVKIATRVSEVKDTIGNLYQVDPEKLYFFVKEGHYFRCQREDEEMHQQVMVKGISSFKRDFIPEIERSKWLPAWDTLPFKLRKNFPPPAAKSPTVRVYIFYGSADSFAQWAQFYSIMPPWVDIVVYEWPGHGQRKEEKLPMDIDGLVDDAMEGLKDCLAQHAEGGIAANAPFAFVGHSIGSLLLLGVAERLKALHGVDPWTVIILDRAAPHVPMCSEFGAQMMRDDPAQFNRIANPQTRNFGQDEESRRAFKMWEVEIQFNNDTKPKGFHTFQCPLHVAIAAHQHMKDRPEFQNLIPEEDKKWMKQADAIFGSQAGVSAMFDRSAFDEWKAWTDFGCNCYDIECDHFALKMHESFLWFLLETLGTLRKQGRPKKEAPEAEPSAAAAAA